MNGIALLIWIVASTGQLGASPTMPGVKYGWKPESDGSMSYIAQVTPEIANQMASGGQEIALDVPDFLQGRVNRVVWRIGAGDVEREPSQAELQANPRQAFPNSGQNLRGPGSLTNLSDAAGQTVMIDPLRSNAATFPSNVGRASDNDPTLPSVPSLAQTYPPVSSRNGLNNLDMPNMNGFSSSTLPKPTLPPGSSSPFIGPTLPPGFNNTPTTVTGAPSTFTGTNTYSDSRLSNPPNSFGSTASGTTYGTNTSGVNVHGSNANSPNQYGTNGSNTYGANNALATGNFGNPQNYAPTGYGTSSPQSGTTGYSPSPNFSSPTGSPYANTQLNGMNQQYLQPYSQPYASSTNPPVLLAQNGQGYPPSNSNYGVNPGQPVAGTQQYAQNPVYPQSPSLLASNQLPGATRPGTIDPRLNESYPNGLPPGYGSMNSQNSFLVPFLLLISIVGNLYLFMLLTNLLQRYRTLQASSRGLSSLGV